MKRVLFFVLTFIFIFSLAVIHNTIDMDYWARLLQGNAFWELGHILKQDPFSYTQTHIWLDHEWGSSVIFSLINNTGGYTGIIIFRALLVSLIFFFMFKTIKLRTEKTNPLLDITYLVTAAWAMPTLVSSCLRCHFFTFLFFTIFLYLLEYIRKTEKYKLLYILPLIMVFWVNIHGGCVSGLGLLFMYALGEFINKKAFKPYLITMFGCLAVMFVNPYGFDYVKFIFMATTMTRPFVTEWTSAFFHPAWNFFVEFKIFYIINFIILLLTLKKFKTDAVKYIVLLACAYLSFKYVKNTPFFVITATVFFYKDIFNFFEKFKIDTKAISYIAIFCVLASSINTIANTKIEPNLSQQPYKITEFIKVNEMKGNILAPFDMCSFIAYKLYPNNLIYMDGRYEEVYYNETKELLDNFFNVSETWDKILNIGLKHDYLIIPRNATVNDFLAQKEDFKYIYTDGINCLWVHKDKLNDRYKLPSDDETYYIKNAFTSSVVFVVE